MEVALVRSVIRPTSWKSKREGKGREGILAHLEGKELVCSNEASIIASWFTDVQTCGFDTSEIHHITSMLHGRWSESYDEGDSGAGGKWHELQDSGTVVKL